MLQRKSKRSNDTSTAPRVFKTEGELELEQAARNMNARLRTPPWLIDPRYSRCVPIWDGVVAFALLFTAIITPYEVALLPPNLDALFWINRLIDLIFAADVGVNFLLIREAQGHAHGLHWITEPRAIALLYLKAWFSLDVFAVLVSALDIFVVVLSESADADVAGQSTEVLSNLVILKILRVLRLIKLARLVKGSALGKRWETLTRRWPAFSPHRLYVTTLLRPCDALYSVWCV